MPKGANNNVGECPCPVEGCDAIAYIRRQKNHEQGALFVNCGTHRQQPSSWLNEYIAKHGKFYPGASPGKASDHSPGQDKGQGESAPKPAGARPGKPPGKPGPGLWSRFGSWLNNWEL